MPDPQLCVVATGRTVQAIVRAREAAEAEADLVELRLDMLERPDAAGALAGRRTPVIVTCRPVRAGGRFEGSDEERLRILREAHALGAEYIDVDFDALCEPIIAERQGRGVIVSTHDFTGTPTDLPGLLAAMRRTGAEIVKLATTTETLSDLIPLLKVGTSDQPTILIGMGASGVVSRILAARFRSRWTYAGDAIAPGQLPVRRMLHEFRFRRIRHDTRVYGVVGRPVMHSLSAAMHNAGFAARGLNAAYVPLETNDATDFRRFADAIGLRGASVTTPLKMDVVPLLDEVTPIASDAGAVNTITVTGGRWIGTNTDVDGFLEPLRRRTKTAGLRATILGAGGAARGVALGLIRAGAAVAISARRPDSAREAAAAIGATTTAWPPVPGSWDLLVNATSVGSRMVPGMPVDVALDGRIVYDLIYDPPLTPLLKAAQARGCTVIGGLEMLVAQAERQFEIWTGQRPPAGLFQDAAEQTLRGRFEPAQLKMVE
ncbi:MAG: shikimate dehydrogenase [Acidobacteria bacterium]|nr:MAG: shikimate dehydrogenase [Acidobacteriota bacterium]